MQIFISKSLVFFAVPKTGTTAIERQIEPRADISLRHNPAIKHIRPQRFNRFLEPYVLKHAPAPLIKMALMREPLDWLKSWYRYRQRPENLGRSTSTALVDFNQFVQEYLGDDRPDYANLGSQHRFLTLQNGDLGVTDLFRYEEMQQAVSFLESVLDQKITLERNNVSPQMDLKISPTLLKELQAKRKADFDLYETLST
ncbi:hypothetical protein BFP76_06700 [Amylibacter kogurei]|uniref:Gamma-glutamyl kinase n=1 Tax=Paramylibacter kogurei TaxID=1889778 RepID=A0A2G5K5P2_9RHOB|nr:gamma-glutamyl kinase [Amylibacter kogurei]PIB24851.1 hypothetical protein BFP76_06700 [Amylibacter kogurei]